MSFYDDASLLTICTAYKSGKLYSVKPTDGSGDFTFSRSTTATRINESGLIESVGVNVPRINYSSGVPSLLLEPQRTNLLSQSNDFSGWTIVNGTLTANFATSPDGTTNASKINFTTGGELYETVLLTSGATYTLSFYAKVSSGTFDFTFGNIDNTLTSGTATTEWQRFEVTQVAALTLQDIKLDATDTGDLLIYGFQVEEGFYSTSYIPTSGTSVTRVADEIGLLQLAGYFPNPSKGTIFFEFEDKGHRGTGSSARFIFRNSVGGSQLAFITRTDGFLFYDYNSQNYLITSGTQVGQTYKFAVTFNEKISVGFANGLKQNTETSVNDFEINEWIFTSFIHNSLSFKNIMFFPTALSDAECIALTTI